MISFEDIRQIQHYPSGSDSLVLSLYINIDQSRAANLNRGFETAAENLLRSISEREAANGKADKFEEQRSQVLRFIRGYTPRGKGLVIFCDTTRGFWWQRDLEVEVPTEARWSPQPWVRPLLDLVEDTDRVGVVLIDKQRSKILVLDATGLEKKAELVSDVPNKHQTTGTDHIWSQGQMDRTHQEHMKWHAKETAEQLGAVIDEMKLTRLVVGGPVEATTAFTSELPKRLQQMVIATVSVAVDISGDKLKGELRSIMEHIEQKDEVKLVETMITSARKGDRAVVGLSETLAAIQEGRVYRLVVDRTFRTEGKQCSTCTVLISDGGEQCSFCGGRLEAAPDLINRASHKVIDQAGKVNMVSGAAAEKLSAAGHVGAILRF